MEIIISNSSAIEYWRLHGNIEGAGSTGKHGLRRKSTPANLPDPALIRNRAPSGLTYPVNLMVGSQNARKESKIVKPRVYTGPTPDKCFIRIGDELAVSSPAFSFFQMAGELPLVKLIELGFELCGSYSLSVTSEYSPGTEVRDKTLYNRPLLTNTKELEAFTQRMEGVSGYKKACRALRYIVDGSASPMETIIVMLLTLPHMLGGYNLPAPLLNKRIYLETTAKGKSRESYYKCDFFWPKANFAIEYDSDSYHTGANRIAADAKKRLDLNNLGIYVVTVTSRQIRNKVEFRSIAKQLARKLGKRLQYKDPQFPEAERDLRNQLL